MSATVAEREHAQVFSHVKNNPSYTNPHSPVKQDKTRHGSQFFHVVFQPTLSLDCRLNSMVRRYGTLNFSIKKVYWSLSMYQNNAIVVMLCQRLDSYIKCQNSG